MAQSFTLPVDPPQVVVMLADSDSGSTVIWLSGEHDLSTVEVLREAITTVAEDDDADLVFDLSGVTFMDTTTLHQIANARSLLARSGRATVIRKPTPFVHRLLEMCRLRHLVMAGPDGPSPQAELS